MQGNTPHRNHSNINPAAYQPESVGDVAIGSVHITNQHCGTNQQKHQDRYKHPSFSPRPHSSYLLASHDIHGLQHTAAGRPTEFCPSAYCSIAAYGASHHAVYAALISHGISRLYTFTKTDDAVLLPAQSVSAQLAENAPKSRKSVSYEFYHISARNANWSSLRQWHSLSC